MLRNLLLSAFLCPLVLAESPKPPATLAELKANPGGLTAYSGDIREAYGQYPVTAVYVRDSEREQVSYLLCGEKVFGYFFRFRQAGGETPLWRETTKAFLDATFPAESFRREGGGSESGPGNLYSFTEIVLNIKAYEEALQSYRRAENERQSGLLTGTRAAPAADAGAVEKQKNPVSGASRSLADYLKSFPDTQPAIRENGMVPGFQNEASYINDIPSDALHSRKAGEAELLIASRRGIVIAYLVKFPLTAGGSLLEYETRRAGLAAAFPDPLFLRDDSASNGGYLVCTIKDRSAFATAREAYLTEEAAKVKALLNP